MKATVQSCAACHELRDLAELLYVHDVETGRSWHVCRPDVRCHPRVTNSRG